MTVETPERDGTDLTPDDLSKKGVDDFAKVEERFDKVDERFDKVDERFDKVDKRFEKLDEKFDRKFDQLNGRLLVGAISFGATLIGAIVALIGAIVAHAL